MITTSMTTSELLEEIKADYHWQDGFDAKPEKA